MSYNMLTPSPSASDGSCSPLSYTMLRNSNCIPTEFTNMRINDTQPQAMPFLHIHEQPVEKFRFRYKSEMGGTHGSLNGQSTEKNRNQTFPTVELINYNKPAIIRCSLYQTNNRLPPLEWQPHAHRLVVKYGNEDVDDPHDKKVDPAIGYKVVFSNMGIIHTARKFLEVELKRKITNLKLEELRHKGSIKLTCAAETEINTQVREQAKSINLNTVCLRFDAFEKENECLYPICDPVYSHCINNLKSALTGELKIVRMDKCTSPASGEQEIYLLVEKVTKKNIKVRFFELDDEDNEIWHDYGKFNDIDVHHQYAIVIKSPPYKSVDIDTERQVFIELHRPSDGSKSAPLQFTYYPEHIRKRKRMRQDNSSSSYSSSDLPTIIHGPISEIMLNSDDLEKLAQQVDSGECDEIFRGLTEEERLSFEFPLMMDTLALKSRAKRKNESHDEMYDVENCRSEIVSLIKTNPPKQRIIEMIRLQLNKVHRDGNNALHIAHIHHTDSNNRCHIKYFIEQIKKYQLYDLLNLKNEEGQTILHIAIDTEQLDNLDILKDIMDLSVQNAEGNTVLHMAVIKESYNVVKQLLKSKDVKKFIDINNYVDHVSALQIALKKSNWQIFRDLCEAGADVTGIDSKDGNTLLHIAVRIGHDSIVTYLVERTNIDILKANYVGHDCQQLATRLALEEPEKPVRQKILKCIEDKLKNIGCYKIVNIKQEPDSDDEMEIGFVKVEDVSEEDMKDMYMNCTEITPECMKILCDVLDDNGKWKDLPPLLDMEHVLKMKGLFVEGQSCTMKLIEYALLIGISVYQIRTALLELNEIEAQRSLDDMVKRANKENT